MKRPKLSGIEVSPTMLNAAVDNANLAKMLDAVLSVEAVGVFKPHPAVYALAAKHFQVAPERIPALPDGEIASLAELPDWLAN